jgi:hypothetical protein
MLQTFQFCIKLLILNSTCVAASTFCLHFILEIENAGIDLYENDVLHNFITQDSQMMNGTIP